MNNKIILFASCGLFAVALSAACGSSDDNSSPAATATTATTATTSTASGGGGSATSTTGASMGGGGGTMNPKPPTLGAQIDRAGRPAVNTALTDPFDAAAAENAAKDAYNVDADPSKWAANYTAPFAKSLAIFDSLDTVCGNQFLAAGGAATTMTYAGLAGALTGDELWLDTSATTCTTYLAVEANATGKIPNMDCGGRTLDEDVIDETYSLLAIGMPSGVGDGVPANDVPNSTTFPYLAAPH